MLSREVMLSREEFIGNSLELNLFFLRIQKEHAFFLEAGFTRKDVDKMMEAAQLRAQFDRLLWETVILSRNTIPSQVMRSGEFVTEFTLDAELATEYFTGIPINTSITEVQLGLITSPEYSFPGILENRVSFLNKRAIYFTSQIIDFQRRILNDLANCQIFTFNYSSHIDHMTREAELYVEQLTRLQNYQNINLIDDALEEETFWDRIMSEHAAVIRGLLDPTEKDLISISDSFAKAFENLLNEAQNTMKVCPDVFRLTEKTLNSTRDLRDFKGELTGGILDCNIKSIILPLLGDHVLREANHYLRLLQKYYSELEC
ncbi:DUF2935 domain-containing protein [Clostridium sp. Marseille-QA1073]